MSNAAPRFMPENLRISKAVKAIYQEVGVFIQSTTLT